MDEQKSYELLIFDISKDLFFIDIFKGDRYATAWKNAEEKYNNKKFHIIEENISYNKFKGLLNAWLTPTGELISTGYMNHSKWAGEFLRAIGKETETERYEYPYQTLCKKGWLRLLNWEGESKKTVIIGDDYKQLPNDIQSKTLKDWCLFNQVPFKNLFKDNTNPNLGLYIGKYE